MVDDMGYGGVSCFDNKNFKTPEIDRLAEDGMKLTDFHSNGTVCSPTRAALMTGRYQQRSGLDSVVNADPAHPMHQRGLHDKEWTFPEAMKEAGYATAIFGKWHLGYKSEYNPIHHGFDEFKGFVSGNIDAHSHRDRMSTPDWWNGEKLEKRDGYFTDLITEDALEFIDENKEQPFLLYIAHGSPHTPIQARGSLIIRGPDRNKLPSWAPEEEYSDDIKAENSLIRHFILPVDEGLGRIRAKLDELNIADNTMIWFLSDNGAAKENKTASDLTRGAKASFYEGGHRVPAVVSWPTKIKAGSVSDQLMLTFDIMPTSMNLAGVAVPESVKLDGRDLGGAIFDFKELPAIQPFWNMGDKGALRDGSWKLVVGKKEDSLYNLVEDSRETKDVSGENPERVMVMRKTYDEKLADALADSPFKNAVPNAKGRQSKKKK